MAEPPRVPPEMFRFTTTERADLHTAVLYAFGEANERLETALTVEEVRERLRAVGWFAPVGEQELTGTLKQLAGWGLLDVIFNHAGSFATAEEYERKNLQYSLTKRGEAAFAGVQHAMAMLASAGALQTAVLDAIADRLGELDDLLRDPDPGRNRRIFTSLQELEGHLDGLRGNTKQFNGELQRLLRVEGTDLATFHEVKAATVAYLQEFVTNLEQRAETIAAALRAVAAHGVSVLHARALDGADLPKVPGADHATPWLAVRAARWEGLCLWFAPGEGPGDGAAPHGAAPGRDGAAPHGAADAAPGRDAAAPHGGASGAAVVAGAGGGEVPRVRQLHDVARRAIVSLLQVLDRITDSRRRSSSAAADFRTLARWFATAPAEDDAHRLWDAAFGLGSARHAHLGHADAELIPAGVPWPEAEPVQVSALLRSRGRTERMGRTGRVRDVAALRAERRARAEKERAELEAAWAALATTGAVRLSQLGELGHDAFGRLLDLLGRALAERPDSTGFRRAVTSDGRVEIVLRAPDDGAVAVLRTPEGWFRGPDYLIDVRSLADAPDSPLPAGPDAGGWAAGA
ncbi:TIGR02677 family protein [Nonomuraea candida]|uniref:TIGR02677 family protein n=1 Tax=Nonomuraea candida TaxID=359159 RepID=UPI000693281F|nr:TIGR02677 family protein [Nonomuraea candida]